MEYFLAFASLLAILEKLMVMFLSKKEFLIFVK